MGECWDAAITLAGEDPPADLAAAVAEELIALWSDLAAAVRRCGGSWSAECDGLVVRIVMLSRLSAVTPRDWVPEPLLASGAYDGILTNADIASAAGESGRSVESVGTIAQASVMQPQTP